MIKNKYRELNSSKKNSYGGMTESRRIRKRFRGINIDLVSTMILVDSKSADLMPTTILAGSKSLDLVSTTILVDSKSPDLIQEMRLVRSKLPDPVHLTIRTGGKPTVPAPVRHRAYNRMMILTQ